MAGTKEMFYPLPFSLSHTYDRDRRKDIVNVTEERAY